MWVINCTPHEIILVSRSRRLRWANTITYIYIYIYIRRLLISRRRWKNVGWVTLAQNRDKWQSLKNRVMNFRVP